MRLPRLNELIPEQERAYLLPIDGDYVVCGPPGTGKTVIALYRAGLTRNDEGSLMLAHSKVLVHYMTGTASREKMAARTSTYNSWFWSTYRRRVGSNPPKGGTAYEYDWTASLMDILAHPPKGAQTSYLIIDEGQDMPQGFYSIVKECARNVTVFADENQRLDYEKNSSIGAICSAFGVDDSSGGLVKLRYNHRNSRPIAELAKSLCVGRTGAPELPDRPGPKPIMRSWPHRKAVCESIVTVAKNAPKKTVGVLLPRQTQVISYANMLSTHLPGRKVQHYVSQGDCDVSKLDFGDGVVTVLTYKSAKGLEFDTVFIPELESYWNQDTTDDENRMTYYVLTSRARERLVMGWIGDTAPKLAGLFAEEHFDWKG